MKSEKEREIESKLHTPVTLNFTDAPLKQVIDDLRGWTDINIYVDQPALDQEGVSLERPVSVKLENVSLKSALNLVLKQVHLTYIIKDEVLADHLGIGRRTASCSASPIRSPTWSSRSRTRRGRRLCRPAADPYPTTYAPTPFTGPYSLPARHGGRHGGRRRRSPRTAATPSSAQLRHGDARGAAHQAHHQHGRAAQLERPGRPRHHRLPSADDGPGHQPDARHPGADRWTCSTRCAGCRIRKWPWKCASSASPTTSSSGSASTSR